MTRKLTHFLACGLLALVGVMPVSAKDIKVNVKRPGTLSTLLSPKKQQSATTLVLKGTLNNDDLRFLRQLCGRDAQGAATTGTVRTVDLRDVAFAPGGAPFLTADRKSFAVSSAHAVPAGLFYECPLDSVVLPLATDSIGALAFAKTRVRTVSLPDYVVLGQDAFADNLGLLRLAIGRSVMVNEDVIARAFGSCHNLAHVEMDDVDYVSGSTFAYWQGLETVRFKGMVGHIDGYVFQNNPRLRSVVFDGTVFSTGGSGFVVNCPELGEVVFNGLVFSIHLGAPVESPRFKGYRVAGPVVSSGEPEWIAQTDSAQVVAYKHWPAVFDEAKALGERSAACTDRFMANISAQLLGGLSRIATVLGQNASAAEMDGMAEKLSAVDKGYYLSALREAGGYARSEQTPPAFDYAPPTDSLLTQTRLYFNLDSIAGTGSDVERMKRLMHWLHNEIRHDGSSSWPECRYNARELYEVAKRDKRGLNCRFLAMMLHELYLAVGIPARYLTCLPKDYDTDSDCHVICVAWSDSLKKWVWMDPSFEAYVTDENGLLLHPGEVRQRLIDGRPLLLNEEANWNNENKQTKEEYLDEYMCKNLYFINSPLHLKSEPEAMGEQRNSYVTLKGVAGRDYPGAQTTDDVYFWQAPK